MLKFLLPLCFIVTGCSLVQEELSDVKELNEQYTKVTTLEYKIQGLEAKQVKLAASQLETEAELEEVKAQLVIEKEILQGMIQ